MQSEKTSGTGVVIERPMPVARREDKSAPVKLPILANLPELPKGFHFICSLESFVTDSLSALQVDLEEDGLLTGTFDISADRENILTRRELVMGLKNEDHEPVLLKALVDTYVARCIESTNNREEAEQWLQQLKAKLVPEVIENAEGG